MRKRIAIALPLALVALLSCSDDAVRPPAANIPPRTFLWLFPDSSIAIGVSRQRLHWWGEDPDGVVRGFLLAVVENAVRPGPSLSDTLRYSWVTRNDTLMAFPLDTLFRDYTVVVRAVDNTFRASPDTGTVRLAPAPYHDRNDNGLFDAGDEALPDLAGAVDPAGSVRVFPIRNTPPTIRYAPDPANSALTLTLPETTYTAATVSWIGADADGDNTIAEYRVALNDTADPGGWLTLRPRDTLITLVVPRSRSDNGAPVVAADAYAGSFVGRQFLGTVQGLRLDALNVFYVKARDVAGEESPAIAMPSGDRHWFVRRPRGPMLLIADYLGADSSLADGIYRTALAGVPGGAFTDPDGLNIARGLTASDKKAGRRGVLRPAFVDPALIHTFLLYDYVLWYTDQYPSLAAAQLSLFTYTQNGGKLIFSTTFETSLDPRVELRMLRDFAPIDDIDTVDFTRPPVFPRTGDTRIPAGFVLYPDSTGPGPVYPPLAFNATPEIHSIFMRPVDARTDARVLYRLQADTRGRYIGTPVVAVVDGLRRTVFVGLPLHLLNNTTAGNPGGLSAFFTRALTGEFSPLQKVARRRF